MKQTLSILVTGKVQGVFYRQSTREVAGVLGIKGQVRNLTDGRVQIIATGTSEQLDQLIQWCRVGPTKAQVSGVETETMPLQDFEKFTIDR